MKKRLLSIFTAIIMVCSFVGIMPKMELRVEAATSTNWCWPTDDHTVTAGWPKYPSGGSHTGIDYASPSGAKVYATCDGEINRIQSLTTSYGKNIRMKAVVNGSVVYIRYCHLSGFNVKEGDTVTAGQVIGYVGSTGNSTGPHLHYEVRNSNDAYPNTLNPKNYLPGSSYAYQLTGKPINTPIDTNYKTPIGNVTPKNTSGLTLVYNVYGVPYDPSVRNIAPGDVCTINEVYATGFCKITYPTSKGNHTEYAKTADFNIRPIDERFAPYMPLTAYLCNNATAYVSTGEIWATDKCTIKAVYTDGTCDVTYPTSKGDKNVRTSLSIFIPNTSANFEKVTAPGKIYAYSRTDRAVNIGYTDPGDACVKIATSGDQVQIIYPIPGGHKLGFVYASELPHNHSFGSWLTTQNATCTANGSKQRKCSICGHTETQTINKLGHSLGNWITKNATCTATGSKTRNCSRCEYAEVQTIAKVPHKYTSKVVDATCKDKGYTQYTCSVCKNTYKDKYTNVTTSHKWGNWTTSKNATCTADGSKTRKCSVCGKSETQTIAKLGHSMSDWTTKNATCTADGSKTRSCTRNGCTHKETQTIAKLGHSMGDWTIKNATCTADGSKTRSCTRNGCTHKETQTIAKLGHSMSDWTTKNATCTADGSKSRSCTRNGCTHKETQTIAKKEHSYTSKIVAPTCTAKGYTLYTCECGDSYKDNYTDKISHKYSAKEAIEATCKKEGYTVYECSVCGAERKDDYVKPTGHKYESEEFNPGNGREPFTLFTCIHCKGSYKDTVSKKHKGDFDKDGTLKVADAVFMKKILTKSHKPTSEEIMIADVNQDGTVNVFDMIIMKRTLMNSK